MYRLNILADQQQLVVSKWNLRNEIPLLMDVLLEDANPIALLPEKILENVSEVWVAMPPELCHSHSFPCGKDEDISSRVDFEMSYAFADDASQKSFVMHCPPLGGKSRYTLYMATEKAIEIVEGVQTLVGSNVSINIIPASYADVLGARLVLGHTGEQSLLISRRGSWIEGHLVSPEYTECVPLMTNIAVGSGAFADHVPTILSAIPNAISTQTVFLSGHGLTSQDIERLNHFYAHRFSFRRLNPFTHVIASIPKTDQQFCLRYAHILSPLVGLTSGANILTAFCFPCALPVVG